MTAFGVLANVGNGAQCEFQAIAFQKIVGIDTVQLCDIGAATTRRAARNLAVTGLKVIACDHAQDAASGTHFVTTCTADKQYATILTDNMIGSGKHINAIGGDCPDKTELHRDFLMRSEAHMLQDTKKTPKP